MKKIVRTVWISLLTGLAFLAACTCTKGLSRSEKKQLIAERNVLMEQIEKNQEKVNLSNDPDAVLKLKLDEIDLRKQVNDINVRLKDDEARERNDDQIRSAYKEIDSLKEIIMLNNIPPCVYGPPASYYEERDSLGINVGGEAEKLYGPPVKDIDRRELKERKKQLQSELDSIRRTLKAKEGACVYGSPEVIERYKRNKAELSARAAEIEKEIEEIDKQLKR